MNFADCTCTPTPEKQGVIYSHTDSQILTTGKNIQAHNLGEE